MRLTASLGRMRIRNSRAIGTEVVTSPSDSPLPLSFPLSLSPWPVALCTYFVQLSLQLLSSASLHTRAQQLPGQCHLSVTPSAKPRTSLSAGSKFLWKRIRLAQLRVRYPNYYGQTSEVKEVVYIWCLPLWAGGSVSEWAWKKLKYIPIAFQCFPTLISSLYLEG